MLRSKFGTALVALALLTAPSLNAQLVTNGGFETGSFAGWTLGGNTGFTGVDAGSAFSGGFGAYLGPVGSTGTLSQSITTTTGALYTLSFWLANDGGTPNFFDVSWGGSSLFSITDGGALPYTLQSFSGLVGGAGTSTTLEFTYRQDPAYLHLDDVDVTSTVPEPASMTLLAMGLVGMMGAGLRRRKKA